MSILKSCHCVKLNKSKLRNVAINSRLHKFPGQRCQKSYVKIQKMILSDGIILMKLHNMWRSNSKH